MKQVKDLQIKPVPIPPGYLHPDVPNTILPQHEFTLGLIAPVGGGKTTLIVNLLKFYKGYFNRIYIFSPTILSDEKWDYVKKLPLLVENKALKRKIRQWENEEEKKSIIIKKPKASRADVPYDLETPFEPYIPEKNFFTEYKEEDLRESLKDQKKLIDFLKDKDEPKYLADRVLYIFDDQVGSDLFNARKDNFFKGFNTSHRHYSSSIIVVSQGYKEIPKTVRVNWHALIIFEIANMAEVEVIYKEFPMGYKFQDWLKIYNIAVSNEHDFLYLNRKKPKKFRMMKNFTSYLFLKN